MWLWKKKKTYNKEHKSRSNFEWGFAWGGVKAKEKFNSKMLALPYRLLSRVLL
jgi:hypothetical protein